MNETVRPPTGALTGEPSWFQISGLVTGYGSMQILDRVDLSVAAGERVLLLGPNGAGKTTLLKTVAGHLPVWDGRIDFDGRRLDTLRIDQRVRHGVAYLSEQGIIPTLTVAENLRLGGYHLPSRRLRTRLAEIYDTFPLLRERRRQAGGSLSGGQRKLLALAKALIAQPRLLVMDEPSSGLSPLLVTELIGHLAALRQEAFSLLVAEQNTKFLDIADRVYVLESGRIRFAGTVADLNANDAVREAYFGLSAGESPGSPA